jgi:transcriptional regulator with XRE-family HTH domain
LGRTLRSWRDRVAPEAVGLPAGGQRRAAGLRREELAMLAGVSADYLIRLEQGRAGNPSAQVLASLARVLQLDTAERDHLYRLAGQAVPGTGRMRTHLTPGVQRLLRRLDEFPVSVHDAIGTILAWNDAWAALLGDPSPRRGWERNVLWRHFTDQPGRVAASDPEAFESAAVGDLRAMTARYPEDETVAALVAELLRVSPRFARLWEHAHVAEHASDRKAILHPEVGRIELDCDVYQVQGSDLRIIVYTAEPGSEAAQQLALTRVIGLQSMR